MSYELRETTFGELEVGAMFKSKSGATWFKETDKRAIGTKPSQGPKGRHWDRFPKDYPVEGEVKVK